MLPVPGPELRGLFWEPARSSYQTFCGSVIQRATFVLKAASGLSVARTCDNDLVQCGCRVRIVLDVDERRRAVHVSHRRFRVRVLPMEGNELSAG